MTENTDNNPIEEIMMPTASEINEKLKKAGILGMGRQNDSFLNKYIKLIAGKNICGVELAVNWMLTLNENDLALSLEEQAKIDSKFGQVIDSLISDPSITESAKIMNILTGPSQLIRIRKT